MLGLACGTKWHAVYALAAFGLLTVRWEKIGTRRAVGVRRPWSASLAADAPVSFVTVVGSAVVTYVASCSPTRTYRGSAPGPARPGVTCRRGSRHASPPVDSGTRA